MKHWKHIALGALLASPLAPGPAQATPLATFATTGLAHDLVNFPVLNGVDYGPLFAIAGTLAVMPPERHIHAMGEGYVYDHSLIAYFEFRYRFTADDGTTVVDDNLYFQDLFASPSDYIALGWVPDGGLPYNHAFDGNRIITAFNAKYRGLADNAWEIYGFRASVRHIYQPLPEPATPLLLGIAALACWQVSRRAGDARRAREAQPPQPPCAACITQKLRPASSTSCSRV